MIPEELLELFFTKKQMYKLKILRELRQGSISTIKIEQSLSLLKRETRELKQSLIQDINNILTEHSCNKLTISQDYLIFSPPIAEEQYVDLLDNMKEMYFLSSPLYKLLIFVLEKRRFTLIEVARSLSYSESHSYKILNKLKEFFFLSEIDIKILKKEQNYLIIGDESSIRMLHYYSTTIVFKEFSWPFISISKQEITEIQKHINCQVYNNLSPLNKKKSDYLIAIFKNALNKNYTISCLDNDVLAVGECIIKNNEKNLYFNHQKKETITSETIYFSFLSIYFTQNSLTGPIKEKLGSKLCSLNNNKIVDSSMALMDSIQKQFGISKSVYLQYIYVICSNFVLLHHLSLSKYQSILSIPCFNGETEKKIADSIDVAFNFLKKEHSYQSFKICLIQHISVSLMVISDSQQKIYVEFSNKPEYKSIVESVLRHTYNEKRVTIIDNYYQADILVSDIRPLEINKKFIYFTSIFDPSSWENLGIYLYSNINTNIIERSKRSQWDDSVHM